MIEASDLRVSYGVMRKTEALRGASLHAASGRITAVVGPNGAGKTTLFRAVLGLPDPVRGTCRVGGLLPSEYRRRNGVGYLPQQVAFTKGWSVLDALKRSVDLSVAPEGRRAALEAAIERTNFDDGSLSKRVEKCSGGTLRRLGIAFALCGDPELVLFDEPFAGLDPPSRRALRKTMAEISGRGGTLLFATHDLHEVAELADAVIVIENGRTRELPVEAGGDNGGWLEDALSGDGSS